MARYIPDPHGVISWDSIPEDPPPLTMADVEFSPLYIAHQVVRRDEEPNPGRLKGTVSAFDLHLPNTVVKRCGRDKLLESLPSLGDSTTFRGMEVRRNIRRSREMMLGTGAAGQSRYQHILEHRTSRGSKVLIGCRGAMPLPVRTRVGCRRNPANRLPPLQHYAFHPAARSGINDSRLTAPCG